MAKGDLAKLRHENEVMRKAIFWLWWMAKRYVDGRRSYAPGAYNRSIQDLQEIGIKFEPDPIDGKILVEES